MMLQAAQTRRITQTMPMIAPQQAFHRDFPVHDHTGVKLRLEELAGENGLLMGFVGEIWSPVNIQRILWLQKHAYGIQRSGCNVALVVRDEPHMLYGFYVSSLTPPPFPLLEDMSGEVHAAFEMGEAAGLVLLDRQMMIRQRWQMTEERIWPRIHDVQMMVEAI